MAFSLSISTRRKLIPVSLVVIIFAVLAWITSRALGRAGEYAVTNAIFTGIGVGAFEEFYVQTLRGRWLRATHPLGSVAIYTGVVVLIFLVALHLTHLLLGHWAELPVIYRRLPLAIPMFVGFAVIGVGTLRVLHFIGVENLFHLTFGTYHRPVLKGVVILFLDVNGSTALAGRLGAFRMSALLRKLLFDMAKPITDAGGDIYAYKGDGLIAVWDWKEAVRDNAILKAIDSMFAAWRREQPVYRRAWGVVPSFRIGVHGGDVVVSVQGDTKRSIGIYGETINIAARMEEAAKLHGVACVISGSVADALDNRAGRILPLGEEQVRGVSEPIPISEYRPAGEAQDLTVAAADVRLARSQPDLQRGAP